MPRRKVNALLFTVLFFSLLLAAFLAWEYFQHNAIQKQVAASKLYWSNALNTATEQSLSTEEFVQTFGAKAELITRKADSVLLRETIHLNNWVCDKWLIDITYVWSGGDGARLSSMTEAGVCL